MERKKAFVSAAIYRVSSSRAVPHCAKLVTCNTARELRSRLPMPIGRPTQDYLRIKIWLIQWQNLKMSLKQLTVQLFGGFQFLQSEDVNRILWSMCLILSNSCLSNLAAKTEMATTLLYQLQNICEKIFEHFPASIFLGQCTIAHALSCKNKAKKSKQARNCCGSRNIFGVLPNSDMKMKSRHEKSCWKAEKLP